MTTEFTSSVINTRHRLLGGLLLLVAFSAVAFADCGEALTQREMNSCFADRAAQSDRALEAAVLTYQQMLDATQRVEFGQVQAQWQKFRDADCAFTASGVSGGSIAPTVIATCLETHNHDRLRDLEQLLHCSEGDISCPAW